MDVDPAYTEVNSGQVENTRQENAVAGTDKAAVFMDDKEQHTEEALSFSEKDSLVLPVVGNVLLDYSMDKAVYHPTMQQQIFHALPSGSLEFYKPLRIFH